MMKHKELLELKVRSNNNNNNNNNKNRQLEQKKLNGLEKKKKFFNVFIFSEFFFL